MADAPVALDAPEGVPTGPSDLETSLPNGTLAPGAAIERPRTPLASMALTEGTANPSTPPDETRARIRRVVPDDFLDADGYPDVC
jgi:hypothetical protein